MPFFKKGRQGTGYEKLTLWSLQRLKTDAYIIKYPEGSSIPPHTDPVDGNKHYRLNLVLKKARVGGLFSCSKPLLAVGQRLFLFRPDEQEHQVSEIEKGSRWVLSVGLAVRKRRQKL